MVLRNGGAGGWRESGAKVVFRVAVAGCDLCGR